MTYDPNGGTGGTTENNVVIGNDYTVRNDEDANVSRPGYTFTGWNTKADQSGEAYQPGDVTNIQGNLNLYAQWTPIETYTVSYMANGGAGEYDDTGIIYDTEYALKNPEEIGITRKNYEFTEWNTKADGTGEAYQSGDVVTVNGNRIFFAQWKHLCG